MTEENIESELEKIKAELPKKSYKWTPPQKTRSIVQRRLHNLGFGILMTALTIGGSWVTYELLRDNSLQKPISQLEKKIQEEQSTKPKPEGEWFFPPKEGWEEFGKPKVEKPKITIDWDYLLLYDEGLNFENHRTWGSAIDKYKDALKMNEFDPNLYYRLGICNSELAFKYRPSSRRIHQGYMKEAASNFNYILDSFPPVRKLNSERLNQIIENFDYAKPYMQLGRLYYDNKEYSMAIRKFQFALIGDPFYHEALYWLAYAYDRSGNRAAAKRCWNDSQKYIEFAKEFKYDMSEPELRITKVK